MFRFLVANIISQFSINFFFDKGIFRTLKTNVCLRDVDYILIKMLLYILISNFLDIQYMYNITESYEASTDAIMQNKNIKKRIILKAILFIFKSPFYYHPLEDNLINDNDFHFSNIRGKNSVT